MRAGNQKHVFTELTVAFICPVHSCTWWPHILPEVHLTDIKLKFINQVDLDRESLLKHPLVQELIGHKWWRIGLPGLIIYVACYLLFLSTLTIFAILVPNPRSMGQYCEF